MKKILLPTLVWSMLLFLAHPALATVLFALPANSPSCYPFGCGYSGEYQQVYTNQWFPQVIRITGLEFYNTIVPPGTTTMNTGNWQISLSSTHHGPNSLSPIYANNIGSNNTVVFSGDLGQAWVFGDTLVIPLSTPFVYDPASQNLLMDVVATGVSDASGDIFFDATALPGIIVGRVSCNSCGGNSGTVQGGDGLLTGFEGTPIENPEPVAMFLVGPGLAGVGLMLKKRLAK